jgi:hypothetical protein
VQPIAEFFGLVAHLGSQVIPFAQIIVEIIKFPPMVLEEFHQLPVSRPDRTGRDPLVFALAIIMR